MSYPVSIAPSTILEQDISQEIVPILASNIEFHPFDGNHYLVQQKDYGFNVKVNKRTYSVLLLVDGKKNLRQLADEVGNEWGVFLGSTDIHRLLFSGKLAACGIVLTNQTIKVEDKAGYLKLRFTIIPAKALEKITHWFAPLFEPTFFLVSAIGMLIFIGVLFLKYESLSLLYKAVAPMNIAIFYGVVLMSAFLHEMGHSAACRRFGATHGDIGFGFYLFTPVLYADVSDAWKLPKKQRVIIDMAGVYMEIILCITCCFCFLVSKNIGLLHIALLKLAGTQSNLNPFIRADAYWAVSDWFNVPNLKDKATQKLFAVWAWIRRKAPRPLKVSQDYFLLTYAIISWVFIAVFLSSVLIYNSQSVLYFPYHLFRFFVTLLTQIQLVDFEWIKAQIFSLFLPFIFYFMLFNLFKQRILKLRDFFKR